MRQIINITRFFFCLIFSLLLSSCDKGVMLVNSGVEQNTKELLNKEWILDSLISQDEVRIPPSDQIYSIYFKEDGTYWGSWDCNSIKGNYLVGPHNYLKITSIGITYAYCPYSWNYEYHRQVHQVYSYEINENRLILYYGVSSSLHYSEEE